MKYDSKSNNDMVRRYLRYIKLQRNLTQNTQEAYMLDLQKLFGFLHSGGLEPADALSLIHI